MQSNGSLSLATRLVLKQPSLVAIDQVIWVQVKVPEILRFLNNEGFLFNHVWGETLREGDENVFRIRRNP